MSEGDPEASWHLDKRVPLAVIITLVIQTFGFGWYASALNSRVSNLESQTAQIDVIRARRDAQFQKFAEDLQTVKINSENSQVQMRAIRANIEELLRTLVQRSTTDPRH